MAIPISTLTSSLSEAETVDVNLYSRDGNCLNGVRMYQPGSKALQAPSQVGTPAHRPSLSAWPVGRALPSPTGKEGALDHQLR